MKIEYDRDADALYIQLKNAQVDDNVDIEEGVTVDLDCNKHIIGIEILDAGKNYLWKIFQQLPLPTFPWKLLTVTGSCDHRDIILLNSFNMRGVSYFSSLLH